MWTLIYDAHIWMFQRRRGLLLLADWTLAAGIACFLIWVSIPRSAQRASKDGKVEGT